MIHGYQNLIVWQRSMEIVTEIYRVTSSFPSGELFGLVAQMRRAAVSIPSNIAEGRLRGGKKEFLQFLRIAFASGGELETQLEIARRLGFLEDSDYQKMNSLLQEVMKMLNSMLTKLSSPEASQLVSSR